MLEKWGSDRYTSLYQLKKKKNMHFNTFKSGRPLSVSKQLDLLKSPLLLNL